VLGRGFQYGTARETALKLAETCYVVTTPFSTADFRHGPAALVERGTPIILFAPSDRTAEESATLVQWLRERGADCLAIGQDAGLVRQATVGVALQLPPLSPGGASLGPGTATVDELLAPIPFIVPGQLLAHYLALHTGLDPDHPRSLTKITHTH
jgi:glutamine---fructose-6-phosphate transaminase (isomerizing)